MTRRSLFLLACTAIAMIALTVVAVGRTSPAIHGYAYPADRACFTESWGSMLNTCSTTRTLFVPATMDKHCTVGASWYATAQSSNSASNVCCRTIGLENSGAITTGDFRCLSSFGSTPQTISLLGANPSSKRVFFVCNIGPNAKLLGVDWDPDGSC